MPLSLRLSVFFTVAALLTAPLDTRADNLVIASNPPGATVEIDGVTVGKTPLIKNYPGGYFHRPRTVLNPRLEHALIARYAGWLRHQGNSSIPRAAGMEDHLQGTKRFDYWLLKARRFDAQLDSIIKTFSGSIGPAEPVGGKSALSEIQINSLAKPAVVQLKSLDKVGSGFFATSTGLIATNKHLAEGSESLRITLASGRGDGRESSLPGPRTRRRSR